MATDDLKARLRVQADDMMFNDCLEAETMREAADAIATLEAQLAARDAEIAAMKAAKDGFSVTYGMPYTVIPNRKDEA